MEWLTTADGWIALLTLTTLEIVLGTGGRRARVHRALLSGIAGAGTIAGRSMG